MKNLHIFLGLLIMAIFAGCAPKEVEKIAPVYYPGPPATPRIQFLTSIKSSIDLEQMSTLESLLLGPDTNIPTLGKSYDVAAAPGKIYTLDRNYRKVMVIDLVEKNLYPLDDRQTRDSQLANPGGITATADGRLYVADMQRRQVIAFDNNEKFLKVYGDPEVLTKPVDVAVFEDNIYVCDMEKHQIVVFNRQSGAVRKTIGEMGPRETGLFNPTHLAVDEQGNIFVTDAFHFMVKKYSPDGELLKNFGGLGDIPGTFARPKGIAVSSDDYLYAVDAATEMIQIFNQQGQLMLFFGGPGLQPGNLYLPSGIAVDNYNAPFFSQFVDEQFTVKYLILATNLLGPRQLNVYGFGEYEE